MAESQTWATPSEVADVVGITTDVATIKRAQASLETIAGVTVDAAGWGRLTTRDRTWLRNAVAYQTAFIAAQPDYFERMRVAAASADGQSATFGGDALELAPLARKALRKLSWRGSRSVRIAPAVAPLDDYADDRLPWRPL